MIDILTDKSPWRKDDISVISKKINELINKVNEIDTNLTENIKIPDEADEMKKDLQEINKLVVSNTFVQFSKDQYGITFTIGKQDYLVPMIIVNACIEFAKLKGYVV